MRSRYFRIFLALVGAAFVWAGCTTDQAGVEAAREILPAAEPLADAGPREESGASEETTVAAVDQGGGDADDSFSAITLLAPALSSVGLETYATACDPFEDPYGACL